MIWLPTSTKIWLLAAALPFLAAVLFLLTPAPQDAVPFPAAAPAPAAPSGQTAATRPLPDDRPFVVLLVGVDYRGQGFHLLGPEQVRSRSDAMLVLAIHPAERRVAMVSIPRDTLVPMPPGEGIPPGRDRINMAFFHAGMPGLKEVLERELSLTVDRYVIIDFQGFARFIDAIGGVTITVEKDLPSKSGGYWLREGTHHLDGETALRLVRHRYQELRADLDRIVRQRDFLIALGRQLQGPKGEKARQFLLQNPAAWKTDLTGEELRFLYTLFLETDLGQVESHTLPGRLLDRQYWVPDPVEWGKLRERLLAP